MGGVGKLPVVVDSPLRVVEEAGIRIDEHFGAARGDGTGMSLARLRVDAGWEEPRQRPDFDEYTLVLSGVLRVEHEGGVSDIRPGQAILTHRGEWVRYSSPEGADYIAVCLPAFTPEAAHREGP